MKYRIVHAFPKGYHVQQKRLLSRWKSAILSSDSGRAWIYPTIDEAANVIERLKLEGQPGEKEE
jgi:hypothetical protein